MPLQLIGPDTRARLRSVLSFASFAQSLKRHGDPFSGRPKSTNKGTPAPLSPYLGTHSGTAQICATATEADMAIEGTEGQQCSDSTCAAHDCSRLIPGAHGLAVCSDIIQCPLSMAMAQALPTAVRAWVALMRLFTQGSRLTKQLLRASPSAIGCPNCKQAAGSRLGRLGLLR